MSSQPSRSYNSRPTDMSQAPPIAEIVLFISTTSRVSVECANVVSQNNLPVKIVRLDSAEIRKLVNSGTVRITVVPTLMVTFEDGTVEMFQGQDKVMGSLSSIFSQRSQPQQEEDLPPAPILQDPELEEEPNLYGGTSAPSPIKKGKKKGGKKKGKKRIDDEEYRGQEEDDTVILDTSEKHVLSQETEDWLSPQKAHGIRPSNNTQVRALAEKMKGEASKHFQT